MIYILHHFSNKEFGTVRMIGDFQNVQVCMSDLINCLEDCMPERCWAECNFETTINMDTMDIKECLFFAIVPHSSYLYELSQRQNTEVGTFHISKYTVSSCKYRALCILLYRII